MSYNKETGMWEGYIYVIRNDIHPELLYFGQTIQEPEKRWFGHYRQCREDIITHNDRIHLAMRKYGKQHFAMDVIGYYAKPSKKELESILNEMERYYINRFDTYHKGYNLTLGGKDAGSAMRAVERYDLDGNYMATYDSVDELKEVLGFDCVSTIYGCCLDDVRYGYGSLWKYKDSDKPLPVLTEEEKREATVRWKTQNPIDMYDYKGNFVKTYRNLDEFLHEHPSVERRQAVRVLNGDAVYAETNVIRYSGEAFDKYRTYREKPKLVEQYDLEGNFIAVHESTRAAGRATGIKNTTISGCCRGRYSRAGEYVWKYVEDNSPVGKYEEPVAGSHVYQYDQATNELIKEFNSVKEASEQTGVTPYVISLSIHGRRKLKPNDYIWSFKKLNATHIEQKDFVLDKRVVQFTTDYRFLAIYDDAKTAGKQISGHKSPADGIRSCCKHNLKTAYGYVWFYMHDPILKDLLKDA